MGDDCRLECRMDGARISCAQEDGLVAGDGRNGIERYTVAY